MLSFLPTKTAIGTTSLLSSRWKNLWTYLPKLDFQYSQLPSNPNAKTNFTKFVDRVLLLHHTPSLRKFRLKLSIFDYDMNRVNSWISILVTPQKIQKMDIAIYNTYEFSTINLQLPCCLFTCESLTSLKIRLPSVGLNVPKSMHISNLKFLLLDGITFRGDGIHFSFSNLEELIITGCLVFINNVEICAPKLKSFTSCQVDAGDLVQINVYAESLMSLMVHERLPSKFRIHNASSLDDVMINNLYQIGSPDTSGCELLRGVCNTKNMCLSLDLIEAVFTLDNSAQLPVFPNLTTLNVWYWDSCNGMSYEVMMLLDKCPNLESLSLDASKFTCVNDEWTFAITPQCFLSHLKSVKLGGFFGTENELSLVKFFLKHTRLLQKIVIGSSNELSINNEKKRGFQDGYSCYLDVQHVV